MYLYNNYTQLFETALSVGWQTLKVIYKENMNSNWLIGAAAWFIPGAGHFLQGRKTSGIIIATVIWIMFIVGILSGGAHYPGYSMNDGFLLVLLHFFASVGNGLGYLISLIFSSAAVKDAAAAPTFEYGGKLIEIAGLVNFMAVLDAVDIFFGRKK